MTAKLITAGSVAVLFSVMANAQEWKSGVEWQEPPVVTPGDRDSDAPSDAIVLFDGTNLSAWDNGDAWRIEEGVAIPTETSISTKQHFGDIQMHIEWSAPNAIEGEGQGRGNSGVFLMGLYEVQVLDSYRNVTYFDGQAASVYKQTPPMVNAMRRPGEWNTYDIYFKAPTFRTNGELETPAYVTVVHNGILVQHHFELLGPTAYLEAPHYVAHAETGPVMLQDHHDAVRYRNIWVRPLVSPQGRRVSAPFKLARDTDKKPEIKVDAQAEDSAK
ncbi:MAG: DUF1080 domain-containing protein [Fuerstiella sp.]|nr:DUF1080 domain-containing protein [Fuerstiella sp.]